MIAMENQIPHALKTWFIVYNNISVSEPPPPTPLSDLFAKLEVIIWGKNFNGLEFQFASNFNSIYLHQRMLYTYISLENSFVSFVCNTYMGQVLRSQGFRATDKKMTSTLVHSIEKKINNWHRLMVNTFFGSSMTLRIDQWYQYSYCVCM